ncbi:uncharacterized protein DNG_02460 [Cephalotrichum gorgonifer]|uniref:Nucleoside phosphorylase domain-containing protein n=1 Tax=Cephalotrichum gorgonifer TaxID=2041049 RepID=A0AAE8STA4_9PEZI|nr:uncharacterized protein DNG_02460 [Cephalotrichum gorgonifer]
MLELQVQDYTVGWITAVLPEYTAAQVFLDERHECPESIPVDDTNHYTCGRIYRHNVVIATLPNGEYGIASAAVVATSMVRTFPGIRIGLMVGIGGGVPRPAHEDALRLGDVVVSTPRNGEGGVFHFNFGRAIQDQGFEVTGFLNQPPRLLQGAVTGLRAKYETQGHKIGETIRSIISKNPIMEKKYGLPDPASDPCYTTSVTHPDMSVPCTSCYDDPSTFVPRPERLSIQDPMVHYGTIASSNTLMFDAKLRDDLAAKKGVLCFEMEAAGLMNSFPCLVIRGICDYSDTHVNKVWQGYAAMTAAAHAKDLLQEIRPSNVQKESTIRDVLASVNDTVATTALQVEEIRTRQVDKEYEGILKWFAPKEYYGTERSEILNRRQPGTGQWFIDSPEYQAWLAGHNGNGLFCHGIPGAGKTVIAAIAIENLPAKAQDDTSLGVAFVYCNFERKDEQGARDLLSSLVKQLCRRRPPLPYIRELHERNKAPITNPTLSQISEAFRRISIEFSRVYIVIDALDECEKQSCAAFLGELLSAQKSTGNSMNILVTSRPNGYAEHFDGYQHLEILARDEDVHSYMTGRLDRLKSEILDHNIKELIGSVVAKAAHGMHGDVRQALHNLHNGVEGLDSAYEQTFGRIQSQAPTSSQLAKRTLSLIAYAKRPLSTEELKHALAVKPGDTELNVEFLPSTGTLQSICLGLVRFVQNNLSGGETAQLVHYTTQEFLRRKNKFPDADRDIALNCITYLTLGNPKSLLGDFLGLLLETSELSQEYLDLILESPERETNLTVEMRHKLDRLNFEELPLSEPDYQPFSSGRIALSQAKIETQLEECFWLEERLEPEDRGKYCTLLELENRRINYMHAGGYYYDTDGLFGGDAFYLYASRYWGDHAREARGACGEIVDFLRLMAREEEEEEEGAGMTTALHWAAHFGLTEVATLLIETDDLDINTRDSRGLVPLSYAADGSGNEALAGILLRNSADVDSRCDFGYSPLVYAVKRGHFSMAKLLLESGANVNWRDRRGNTPLIRSPIDGNASLLKLLLEKGADIEARNDSGSTALLQALSFRQGKVAEMLISQGANVNVINDNRETPIYIAASRYGFEPTLAQMLLERGADVSLGGRCYRLLSSAARSGHDATVQLLLTTNGIDPNWKDINGYVPLAHAARRGNLNVVKRLLDPGTGVEPDARDSNGLTPLATAAVCGHDSVVELLLATHGVDPNARDLKGWTPLAHAAASGHAAVVKRLLVAPGPIPDARDIRGRTSLSMAAENGHLSIVELLLTIGGVDPNSEDNNGWTPLAHATERGHVAVMECLLKIPAVLMHLLSINANAVGHHRDLSRRLAAGDTLRFRLPSESQDKTHVWETWSLGGPSASGGVPRDQTPGTMTARPPPQVQVHMETSQYHPPASGSKTARNRKRLVSSLLIFSLSPI